MAFSESTGQLILKAAQGVSRTIQVQRQMAQRQAEREQTQALEVSNLKAKNERDKLAAEKAQLDLVITQQKAVEGARRASPEAQAKRAVKEEAELENLQARTIKIKREERQVGTATARKAAERFGLVSAVQGADSESVTFINAGGQQTSLQLSTVKPELLRLAQTGDVDTLRTERGRAEALIADLQQAPAFAFGDKSAKATISSQIATQRQKIAMITYLQDTANRVAAGASDSQILASTKNPAERAVVSDALERENLSSKLASVTGEQSTKIDTAFDNSNGDYAEVVRMFSGTKNPTVLRTIRDRARQNGIPDKTIRSMLIRIGKGTNNTEE